MSEINVRSESVDVEQIMRQIRARIREKRGVDYTEAELQQLASAKLERFLDPRGLRSDLIQQYQRRRAAAPAPPSYTFEADTLYVTHRGLLRIVRRLLRPLVMLVFNPDRLASALQIQSQLNVQNEHRLRQLEDLSYELLHNLTLEVTRLGIEVHNLKMRVESLSSRVDFDERRARSLESVVQYRQRGPERTAAAATESASGGGPPATAPAESPAGSDRGPSDRRRRRRRRRRRPGHTMADTQERTSSPGAADDSGEGWNETGNEDTRPDAEPDAPDSSDAQDQ